LHSLWNLPTGLQLQCGIGEVNLAKIIGEIHFIREIQIIAFNFGTPRGGTV
jgi:hypothetical protein